MISLHVKQTSNQAIRHKDRWGVYGQYKCDLTYYARINRKVLPVVINKVRSK